MSIIVGVLLLGAIAPVAAIIRPELIEAPEQRFARRQEIEDWVRWAAEIKGEINEGARL